MSMYLLPNTTTNKLDKKGRSSSGKVGVIGKKYNLVKWDRVCANRKKDGLELRI